LVLMTAFPYFGTQAVLKVAAAATAFCAIRHRSSDVNSCIATAFPPLLPHVDIITTNTNNSVLMAYLPQSANSADVIGRHALRSSLHV
jgi:hypothetical protein